MSDDLEVLGSDGIRRTYDEHYDTMMDVEQDPTGAWQAIHNQHDRIEELEDKLDWVITERDETFALMLDRAQTAEAKLAKAVGLLEAWINVAAHCNITDGVCCCGDDMDTHAEPMNCGHLPVDHGAYIAESLAGETNTTLAELKGGKDE